MPLVPRAKYPFGKGVSYLQYINSPVGVIRDTTLQAVLEDIGLMAPSEWARSVYEPEPLFEALARYNNPRKLKDLGEVEREELKRARTRVWARFRSLQGSLTPASLELAASRMKLGKSSGAPYFTKKGDVITQAMSDAVAIGEGDIKPPPCVAYYRTQNRLSVSDQGLVSSKQKVRLVWGFPVSMTMLEGMFAIPVIDALKGDKAQAIASGLGKAEIGARVDSFNWEPTVMSFDWSKFDSTIPAFLISWAFDVIWSWYTPDAQRMWAPVWERIKLYFLTTPIIMPDGRVWAGKREGIPSGSYFTSVIGSLVNLILIDYLSWHAGTGTTKVMVLGDDSIVGYVNKPDVPMMREAASRLGMTLEVIDVNYQRRSRRNLYFLGHYWERGRPVRPLVDTIQRIVHLERDNSAEVKQIGISLYRYEKLVSLYGDNIAAWTLVRYLIMKLRVGKLHRMELGKTVRNRATLADWDMHTQTRETPIALISFR